MIRQALTIGLLLALSGCGAAYEEGGGAATPQVEYANAQGEANLEAQANGQNGEVQIGGEGDVYEDTDPTALTEFRTTLDPYGTWVEDDSYGTVWVPSTTVVGADFAPYVTSGHWSYGSDYVWVSDYDWGWAPFHYGRWVWIGGRGWSWLPGRRYAGAWVTWRTGYDGWGYVGWAPLPPAWYWRGGYAYGLGWSVHAPYVFCAHEHVFAPNVGTRIVAGAQVAAIGQHTRPYTPATPGVGVGGRNPANPTVGGGYSTGGPPPGQLGIQSAPVPPSGHAGLMKAQQYATPSSATAVGARAPQIGSAAHASIGSTAMPNNHSPSFGSSYGGRSLGSTYVPPPRPYVANQSPQSAPYQNAQPMPRPLPSPSPQYQPRVSPTPTPQYQPQYQPHFSPTPTPQYQPQYQPHFSPTPTPQYQPHFSPSPQQHSFGGGSSVSPAPRSFSPSPSVGGGGGGGGFGGHVGGGGSVGGGSRSMGGGRVGGRR